MLGKGQGSQPLSGDGNCCQPREVDSNSISDHCLLGNQDRLADFPGFSDSLEDQKVLLNSRRISVLKGAVCEVLESLARPPRLSVSPCSEWSASNESSSIGSKSRLGFSGRGYPGSLDPPSRDDLRWWCTDGCLEEGISLALRSPAQMFWSDVSNLGWEATVEDQFASGVWLEGEVSLSINQRELLAVERGIRALCTCLEGRVVAVFSDNTTAVAYLRRQGETLSPALNAVIQRILLWAEGLNIILMPQFVPGRNNVEADALSRPNQVLGSEWMLHQDVFNWLRQRWPVTIDLFASSLSHRCSVYFAPVSDPMAVGTDAMLQSWDSLRAYAFPPFAMIGQLLAKVRTSQGMELSLIAPLWPQRPWFPELLELLILPLFLFHLGGIFCVSHTSEDSIKICPCFVFMCGDSPEIRESLQLLS